MVSIGTLAWRYRPPESGASSSSWGELTTEWLFRGESCDGDRTPDERYASSGVLLDFWNLLLVVTIEAQDPKKSQNSGIGAKLD